MNQEELKKFYENRAKEAEDLVLASRDEETRDRWKAIAEGYRTLARGRLGRPAPKG